MTQPVRVREAAELSPTLRRLVLERADGGGFPAVAAGAHATFWLDGDRPRRNAYSLATLADDGRHVAIVVRKVISSRGGSAALHGVRRGDLLRMGLPHNMFAVPKLARSHVLLSAGIGITPFLAYLPAMAQAGVPAHLHQICRAEEAAAFADLLGEHAAQATIHPAPPRPDLACLLSGHPVGTHLSLCGPEAFMAAAAAAARAAGFAPSRIHRESFAGAAPGAPFVAVLANGRRVAVAEDSSLLEALEQAGLSPPYLCRGGACGQCRVGVLSGVPEHRDHVLSPEQRARGDVIMTCVSRAASPELTLDL